MATLEDVTGWIRARETAFADIGKTVKLDFKGQGFVHIGPEGVSNADNPADLVIRVALADLVALSDRKLDPTKAMLTGRLKFSNMGLAMKLQPVLLKLFGGA